MILDNVLNVKMVGREVSVQINVQTTVIRPAEGTMDIALNARLIGTEILVHALEIVMQGGALKMVNVFPVPTDGQDNCALILVLLTVRTTCVFGMETV